MQCEERTQALNLFLDSTLESADQTELFSHLSMCEECRSYVSTMMKISRVGQRENISFPGEIDDTIMHRISMDESSSLNPKQSIRNVVPHWKNTFQIPVPVAYALVAAAIVLSFFLGQMNTPVKENTQMLQTSGGSQQPTAVIYVYGLPPVEVIGKATKAVYQQ